jgi:phospholipid/cholesterol/gamma-HCH transport system permease protein
MHEELAERGLSYVGAQILAFFAEVGRVALLVRDTLLQIPAGLTRVGLIVQQMYVIGVGSVWLVIIVSLFTGAVAAVQAAYQFASQVPLRYLGSVILRSVIIELGPVLTALVVGGRVGASIAAELGTMKVTEQIDALESLGINPVRYLVVPRFLAAIIMLPLITVIANALAIFGGYVVAVSSIGISTHTYVMSLKDFFYLKDLFSGLIKSFAFGGIISIMGCHYGFATEGGAEGVGAATTRAVVSSCVLILISDYVLANVFFRLIFK